MLSPLLFAVIIAVASTADITDNQAPELVGDYKLAFVWPKTSQEVPNCYPTTYKYKDLRGGRMTCDCGRKDANLALLWQDTKYIGKAILFDIVDDVDGASGALADSCRCEPINLRRVVAVKLNDNLMLQYEQEEILRHYIFAKTMPSETELREVISTLKDLKYEDGQLACK